MFKKPMAPNDPNRVPKHHRELINKIYNILASSGNDVFASQHIMSSAALLCRTKDLKASAKTLMELIEAIDESQDAQRDIQAITEVLTLKMTETMNRVKLLDLEFEEM